MKKLLWLCLMMITACGFIFSACNNDPYKDMQLLVEQDSIEIVLQHDVDADTPSDDEQGGSSSDESGDGTTDEELPPNTAYLDAHIENKNDSQSKVVLFDIVDKSLATISVTEENGVYRAEIVAIAPGETEITVMSQEGGKVQKVPLKIIEPITGLAFDANFSLAVAVGQSYQFTSSNFNFEPTLTNQKDIIYSLENAVQGVTITENGLLTTTEQPIERYVTVVATSVSNPDLVTTTQVYIYNALEESQIHLYSNGNEITDALVIGKNTNFNNVDIEVVIDDPTEDYIAYATVDDISVLNVERSQNENLIFRATGIEQSQALVTFRIGIQGISEQVYIEKILNVQILDLIDSVYVNGASGTSSITVFDTYASTGDTAYGTRVLIEVTPTNAQNKKIAFRASSDNLENLRKLDFYNSSGQLIEDILSYEMTNSGVLYVRPKADQDFTEFVCTLEILGNPDFDEEARVSNFMTINVKNGINNIAFNISEMYIDLADDDYQEYQYLVNGITVTDSTIATSLAGFDLDDISVLVQRPGILSAVMQNGRLYIRPLSTGTTTLTLRAPNGISTEPATITVVVPTDSAAVDVDTNAYSQYIASIERDENNLLTKINANVNSTFALNISKSSSNGTIWNLTFQSSHTTVATVTNQGTIRGLSTGTTIISVSFNYARYDAYLDSIVVMNAVQDIEVFIFMPITEFNIGKSSATVYDVNTIGYYEAPLYSTVDFNVMMNDAYIERSAIRIYINGETFDIENSSNTYQINGQNGILFYYGEGRATFLGKIGNDNYTASVGIVAEIHEFNRTYRSICNVTINKATMVNEIVLYNTDTTLVDGQTYYSMYFKAGLGLGEGTSNTQQIRVSTLPANAMNGEVYYFAYDYEENNTISNMTQASEIISVSQDGVVTPLKAGSAKIVIVPRDQLHNYDLNYDGTLSMNELLLNLQQLQAEGSQLRYKEIIVNVADGTLENPYQISSAVDFLNISTGLNDHYVLVQTIDLSRVDLSALGSLDTPFTGSINGRHYLENPSDENPEGVYIDSRILGVRLNQTFENITSDVYYGLFGVVKGSVNFDTVPTSLIPSFSNLYIEFTEYNINIVGSYTDTITFNLGFLTAQLEGAIDNVQIVMRNPANITNNSQAKINFGAMAGVVNQSTYEIINQDGETEQNTLPSYISNSKLIGGGNITINSVSSESYIGGFVGLLNENTSVSGQYAFVNDTVSEDNNFVFSFNGQDNDLVFSINVIINTTPTLMGVGGIVGKNFGTVQKVSAFGTISVRNSQDVESGRNIGGVVGYNDGEIEDVFSRCAVIGNTNVGGIVGANVQNVSVAVFESYQDGSSYVQGREMVGGVIGLMQGGTLDYGSSTSFITGENYAITGYASVGGLVGQTTNGAVVSRSQATTKIGVYSNSSLNTKYAGGLIGIATSTTIQNSYSISDIYRIDTMTAYTMGGFIGRTMGGVAISNTYSVSNIDNFVGNINSSPTTTNSYYLSGTAGITSGGAQGKSSDELKVVTTFTGWDFIGTFRMSENVNQGYPYLIYSDSEFITVAPTSLKVIANESVDNEHIKISDNRIVLFNQQLNEDDADEYVVSLNSLIGLEVAPLTNRIVRVNATLETGADVIRIDGGDIIIIGQGYAKIKISSQLNEDVYDYLEIYVVDGLNSFSDNTNGELNLLKGTSTEIRYTFENGYNVAGSIYGIAYKDLYNYASFNYSEVETIEDIDYTFVDYNFTKIITALDVVENTPITQYAFVNANFDGEIIKVLLPWTEKTINMSIYNGATNLQLDRQQSNIMPSQTASIEALITTDINTEIISSITIYNGDNVVDNYSITVEDGYEPNLDNIVVTRENSDSPQLFELDLITFDFDEVTNQLSMVFEFTPTVNLQNTSITTNYNVEFNLQDKFIQNYSLTVIPQTVERISALHFPDGNLREDEVATDRISSGVEGLLSINLYPSYSQVDYVDITSEPVNGEQITFVQWIMNNGQLERLYPDAQQIPNGIRLSLASYRGDNGYVFDGYLYVSTLIRSDMPENLPFVINIVAYKDGQAIYTYSKTLVTQFSPKVTIDYNANYNNQFARGTTLNVPISVTTMAGTLTLTVEDIQSGNTVIFTSNQTSFTGRYVGTVMSQVSANISLQAGTTFKLRVELDTVVDNVRMVVTDEIDLTIVDYIILGVEINGYYTQGTNNLLDVNMNSALTLQANISALYATRPDSIPENSVDAEPYKDIEDKIEAFERLISRQHDVNAGDIPVWYTSTQAFDSTRGSTGYYNYQYSTTNGGYYSVYGTRVSTVDLLTLSISYYYDIVDGQYQPVLINVATDPTAGKTIYSKSMTCTVNVVNDTTEEVPLPIYSQSEFEAMQEGAHYILMNDITLETYTPMDANFASLDGNGFIINLNSFAIDTTQSTVNVGLFASVSSSTLIKNVVLNVNGLLKEGEGLFDVVLTGINQVNFGLFAATNAGSITNCEVVNIVRLGTNVDNDLVITGNVNNITLNVQTSLIISSSYTTNYIALFVAQNTGYITNSRVGRDTGNIGLRTATTDTIQADTWQGGAINLIANGIVAGFVAMNSNTVSSSYVKNVSINNNTVIANVSSTAGFVAMNGGSISSSYAEGRALDTQDNANLKSQGTVAGFVLENDGQVSNSYSSFIIRSPSNSAGFVSVNGEDASIEYSYTTSTILVADGEVTDNASFRPFTGVNDFNEIQNEGTISYSYYIKDPSTVVFADEPAIAINSDARSQQSEYVGFAFVNNSKFKSYGIWELDSGEGQDTYPRLTSANQIAISMRELTTNLGATSQEEAVGDEPLVYSYVIGYEYGTEINPYIINSAVKFNNLFTNSSGQSISRFGTNILNIPEENDGQSATTNYVRIVNDLNFAQTSATATGLNSSKTIFSAVLEGNNMLLSNITLSGERSADVNQLEFGLFERMEGAVVKNLRLHYSSVSATEIPVVGALAGSAVDSILLGISIEAEDSVVQGKNIVGGLVGVVVGESEIQTISSNIDTRATFRKGTTALTYTDISFVINGGDLNDPTDLIYTTVNNALELVYDSTSYAGGILGAVIYIDGDTQIIRTLKVSGKVSVAGERTGGIVGVNYGHLYDLNFVVQMDDGSGSNQELSGDDLVGGIVGVNFNRIEKARITYEGDELDLVDALSEGVSGGKTNLFISPSNYIGGIVGSNIGGSVIDSYSRVNVVNANAQYAGGIAGYTQGGIYESIYTTGNVQSAVAFGGMIGYMDEYIVTISDGEETTTSTEVISQFSNIVLANNFTVSTAQVINRGTAVAGALAGYVNVADISELFAEGSSSTNYAIYRMPLNTSSTSYVDLQFFGSARRDQLDITEEEYAVRLANLNNFTSVENEDLTYSYFDSKAGDYATASYSTLYRNRTNIFSNYSTEDWTKDTSIFPLLNITTQATEIIIDESNRGNLLQLLQESPNATFIIRCDIDLYSTSNQGMLTGDWTSLGNEAIPFSGSFQGERFTTEDGTTRYPIINIRNPFLNYARNARISNLTFNVNSSFTALDEIESGSTGSNGNFYYGVVANYSENCAFSNLQITTSTQNPVGINVTYNRDNTELTAPKNYIGGVIGYDRNSTITGVDISIPISVRAQDGANDSTQIETYVGGIVGYALASLISNSNYNILYNNYMNGRAYMPFMVYTSNGVVGGITGYSQAAQIASCNIGEQMLIDYPNDTISVQATTYPVVITSTYPSADNIVLNFGGISGYDNNSNIRNVQNNLTTVSVVMDAVSGKTEYIGGIVGHSFSSTVSDIVNNAKVEVTSINVTTDGNVNNYYVGGLIGYATGEVEISGSNNGEILVEPTLSTSIEGYVGGVVGFIELNASNSVQITMARNTANITTNGLNVANVGGIVGRISLSAYANDGARAIISRSYSDGDIKVTGVSSTNSSGQSITTASTEYIGGLIGFANRLNVSDSYSVGNIESRTNQILVTTSSGLSIGGFIGRLQSYNEIAPVITNVYTACIVRIYCDSVGNNVNSHGFIGSSYLSRPASTTNSVIYNSAYYILGWAQTNAPSESNRVAMMHDTTANAVSYAQMLNSSTFRGFSTSTWTFENGNTLPILSWASSSMGTKNAQGTVYRPNRITNIEELLQFCQSAEDGAGQYYVLTSNLTVENAQTRQNFNGVFDGSAYIINGQNIPLFNNLGERAYVNNLNIQGVANTLKNSGSVGGLANVNNGTVSYITTNGYINFDSSLVAGTTNSLTNIGGIVGTNYGHIAFSSSNVEISQTNSGDANLINIGGIAGYIGNVNGQMFAQISNSFASGTMTMYQTTGTNESLMGGLVGLLEQGNLRECYVNGRINYLNDITVAGYGAVYGGDVRSNLDNTILDNVNIEYVYNDYLGTLVRSKTVPIGQTTIDTTLASILENNGLSGFDPYAWNSFAYTYSNTSNTVTMLNYGYPYLTYANNTVTQIANKGVGTNSSPYLITNQSGFDLINYLSGSAGNNNRYYYALDDDIYCYTPSSNETELPSYIDTLNGVLTGNSRTIYNMNFTITNSNLGFINTISADSRNESSLQEINFVNVDVTVDDNFSAMTGISAIVGTNNGTISNVNIDDVTFIYNNCNVSAGTRDNPLSIGGVVGINAGDITNTHITDVEFRLGNATTAAQYINLGGFVGLMTSGSIGERNGSNINCSVEGITIQATSSGSGIHTSAYRNIGGFVGYRTEGNSTINNCAVNDSTYSQGNTNTINVFNIIADNVDSETYIGGFAGYTSHSDATAISNAYSYTNINVDVNTEAQMTYVGGIAGYAGSVFNNITVFVNINNQGSTSSGDITKSATGYASGTDRFIGSQNILGSIGI